MSEQTTSYVPQDVARELDVSPATLRRWAQRFGDFLSPEATSTDEGRSHRRYSDTDLMILQVIKELMNSGMTYDQVQQQLALQFAVSREEPRDRPPESPDDNLFPHDFPMNEELEELQERGLVASNGNEAAVAFLTNTLATLSESQKSILNSQAANRELMGVLIQDNFNLKEENSRLRERILDVERNLAHARQENEWQRENLRQELDAKISVAQQLATQAIATAQSTPAPEIKAVKSKPGCLGRLLGASGDIQVVSIPRPREKRADGRPMGTMPPSYSPSPPQPSRQFHPKPTRPPE